MNFKMLLQFLLRAKNFYIVFIFLGCLSLQAQVFIPHSFWRTQPLVVSPTGTQYIVAGDILTFSASGASGTFAWSVSAAAAADGASIATPGSPVDYVSRGTPYTADTVITTSGTSTINTTINTYTPLAISPTLTTVAINTANTFVVSNGYCLGVPGACTAATATWSKISGLGSISAAGVYSSDVTTGGTSVVQVADSIGNIAQATITIVSVLTIIPTILKLPVYSTMNYSAILGAPNYTYTVPVGTGTVGCVSTLNGAHTNAVTTITVINTTGCPSQGVIYVEAETICYTGITATTFTGATRGCDTTTAAAHATGITYNLNRKVYTAPSGTGSGTVRVTDTIATSSDSTVTHVKPVDIKVGYAFGCVLFNDGSVKCWGENNGGQLGVGSAASVGDLETELGGANQFVNLGVGRTATKIATGWYHTCALLDNSTVKCWGQNTYGQLGQNNFISVGVSSANDVANISAINFGARVPNDIWSFAYTSCAKFTDNSSVCWGLNTSGQLGQGTTTNIDPPPATGINYGVGRYATKLVGGPEFTCAILDDATVKCWGLNTNGQLGYNDTTQRTSPAAGAINLGVGRTATDLTAASNANAATYSGHACAVLDNGTVACWGRGSNGQLGDNTSTQRNAPTQTTALGFTASKIWSARRVTCVKSTINTVKCWGQNTTGQCNAGNTTDPYPDAGAAPIIDFGTGVQFSTMATAGRLYCMISGPAGTSPDRVKCWGRPTNSGGATVGALLYFPNTTILGDAFTGDNVPFLNY